MTNRQLPKELGWVRSISENYKIYRLGSLTTRVDQKNRGLKSKNLLSLSFGSVVNKDINTSEGLLPASFENYNMIRSGDIVLRLTDLQNDKRSLRSGLAHEDGIITSAYTTVRPGTVDSSYLNYFLRAMDQAKVFYSMGGGLRQSMTYDDVKTLPVIVPSTALQRQIADYLDHETAEIDAFIDDLNRLAHLSNERMRKATDESLSSAALLEETAATILGRIIDINEGQIDPRLNQYREMPLIAPNHIESRTSRILEFESAYEQGAESGKYFAHKGQVLYSKIRPALMKASIAPVDCLCSADMYAISGRSPWISNDFLLEYLLSPQFESYAVTMSDRVAMPKLNRETLNAAPVTLPSLAGQRRIVEINRENRRKSSALIFDVTEFIDLARERRAALITAAVTGQIDVTAKNKPAAEQLEDDIAQGLYKES